MYRSEVSLLVSEAFVVTIALKNDVFIFPSSDPNTDFSLVNPVFSRGPRQGELDEPIHLSMTVVVSVHKLWDEVACEGYQERLNIIFLRDV